MSAADARPQADLSLLRDEFVALTSRLISIKSTADRPDELNRCADVICDWLREHSIHFQRLSNDGLPSILVGNKQADAKVLLLAHFDVVDAAADLFRPEVQGNILRGRGSIDDKYAVALGLLLFREHLAELRRAGKGQEALPFMLLFTGDEETGGTRGAGFAVNQILPRFCIALDGGSPTEIITRQKGVLRLRLTAGGRSAHGARPWLGENAAVRLIRDCLTVEKIFADLVPEDAAPASSHWHPTCNLGLLRAGRVINQVPDEAVADFDIRFTEDDSADGLAEAVRLAVGSQVEVRALIPPLRGLDSPLLPRLLVHAPAAATGRGHGASDAQFFSERGIPCVVWGAEGDNSQHGPDEHLLIDSALQIYRHLDAFLRSVRDSE